MAGIADFLGMADTMAAAPVAQAPQPAPAAPQPAPAPVAAPQAVAPGYKGPSFLRNFLGALGDGLLVANGHQPIYGPRMKQRRLSSALSAYLGASDPGLVDIMAADPSAGLQLWKMKHPSPAEDPDTIRLMRAAGIDPASPEGKAIIQHKLSGSDGAVDPTFVRELQALGIDPHSPEALELFYGKNSPAGYLLKPRQPSGGPSAGPKAGQVVNGYRFRGGNPNDKANWEPAGGASPSGSQTFP